MLSTTANLTAVALAALSYISKSTNKPAIGDHEEQGQADESSFSCLTTVCLNVSVCVHVFSHVCVRLAWLPLLCRNEQAPASVFSWLLLFVSATTLLHSLLFITK